MNKPRMPRRFSLVMIVAFTLSGCAHHEGVLGVDRCADIPAGAVPETAGAKICNWETMQVSSALADQSVMYRSDFVGATADLSPAALERIGRLAHSGSSHGIQWFVEPSDEEELDIARVESVTHELSKRGVSSIDVSIATPAAVGLSGPQAERIASGLGQNRNAQSNSRARTSSNFGARGFRGSGGLGRAF